MANIKDKTGEQPQLTGGGMQRVLNDSSESMQELRDFMQGLRGKSPQEVLGDVANSSLVRSTLTAAVGFFVVIVGLSLASYYWQQAFGDSEQTTAKVVAPADEAKASQEDAAAKESAGGKAEGAASPTKGMPSGDQTLDNLGIGETKQANPDENPLENTLDNLLDGAN